MCRQTQTKEGGHSARGGMNQDTESETLKTPLETEIYMMLLHNLICESGDRGGVGGGADRVREKERVRVQFKRGLSVRLLGNRVETL